MIQTKKIIKNKIILILLLILIAVSLSACKEDNKIAYSNQENNKKDRNN